MIIYELWHYRVLKINCQDQEKYFHACKVISPLGDINIKSDVTSDMTYS